jgi:hypothetical protein
MAPFVLTETTPLSATQAWQRITDWPAHGRYVPLTTVTVVPAGPSRLGTVFTARTALGRLGFDDPMEVVAWQPPAEDGDDAGGGHCRLEKRGRVMLGWAEITVEPTAAGSTVTWREDATPRGLPTFAAPLAALAGRLLFGRVMRKLLA